MKKVVLFFAVATAVALASCGGSQPANTEAEETVVDTVAVEQVVEETVETVADSTVVAEIPVEEVVEEPVAAE